MLAQDDGTPNPRVRLGARDAFMCWNCGHLNFHERLHCISCFSDGGVGGDWRMRLGIHELILAAATDVFGAAEVIDEIDAYPRQP